MTKRVKFCRFFTLDGTKRAVCASVLRLIEPLFVYTSELSKAMASSTKTWANARSVKSMIENCYVKRAMRYGKRGKLDREITAEDIATTPSEHRNKIGFFT